MKKSNIFFTGVAFAILTFQFLTFNGFAQYTKLLDLDTAGGSAPYGSLFSDGTFLYGMTNLGGTGMGNIFKIKPDGTGYSNLLDFAGTANGSFPRGSLISDGTYLYGMTQGGGTGNPGQGTIFKIMPDGSGYSKLYDFPVALDGGQPSGSLIFDGTFLYGMTEVGGTNGAGVIFKLMPNGTGYTKLLDFDGTTNGQNPYGSLISDGTFLYGMTKSGGATLGQGTVFKIMPDGTGYVKLLTFTGSSNGSNPYGDLITDGTFLYGMTSLGGANAKGTIFKIMPDGTGYVKLLDFAGITNGKNPQGSLISDGTFLYGMAQYGGTGFGSSGQGLIFKIKPDGTGYSKLLDFTGANGSLPYGSLISDGTFLYGMTTSGGINNGTAFKYNPYCATVTFTQTPIVCTGQSITVGVHTYSTSGTFIDTLRAVSTCDSIITTNLTVNDTSVSISNATLTANASPATYQWVNCTNGNAPIVGQTSQSFTATANGSYSVIVTQSSCSDTSSCFNITTTGIAENNFVSTINIYPNPFNSQTAITFTQEQKNITIKLLDVLGKEIKSIRFTGKQLIIEKGEMEAGTYFLQVKTEQGRLVRKLIIQ